MSALTVADSSFLIDFMLGDASAIRAADEAAIARSIRIPTVVLQELVYDARKHRDPDAELARIAELENRFGTLAFDSAHARLAGTLEASLENAGHKGGKVDVQVAATALVEDAEILTRDKRFPRVDGVRVRRY